MTENLHLLSLQQQIWAAATSTVGLDWSASTDPWAYLWISCASNDAGINTLIYTQTEWLWFWNCRCIPLLEWKLGYISRCQHIWTEARSVTSRIWTFRSCFPLLRETIIVFCVIETEVFAKEKSWNFKLILLFVCFSVAIYINILPTFIHLVVFFSLGFCLFVFK